MPTVPTQRADGSFSCLKLDALSVMSASGPASDVFNCYAPFTIDAWQTNLTHV